MPTTPPAATGVGGPLTSIKYDEDGLLYAAPMPTPAHVEAPVSPLQFVLRNVPAVLLAPVPLALMQPILDHIAAHVARSRPELFARLGAHAGKRFLIDPVDLPFVLVLTPDARRPHLKAYRRYQNPDHDAGIAGTFFNLLDMIDGVLDGDALFFSRDLQVSGDTEAVVALRNALDDFEGSALDSVVAAFGPLSKPVGLVVSAIRARRTGNRHA